MISVFIITVYTILAPVLSSLCPVLSSYASEPNNIFHGYPIDTLLPTVLAKHSQAIFRNCSDRNKVWSDTVTKCSTDMTMCAVTQQNVNTALSIADRPQYAEAFHRLNSAIHSKNQHHINLIIIGGSMTQGSCTFSSCLCNNITESTCPAIPGSVNVELTCAWPEMLKHWIAQTNPQIKVINLSQSGYSSTAMADNFADLLRINEGRTSLNSSDIVMIDHSVNDFAGYAHTLQHGFESLLRRILHLGANSSQPTIMVIEQYPLGSPAQIKSEKEIKTGLQGSVDYATTYRTLCRHYGVILISLREVFLTYNNFTIVKNVQTRMYPMPVTRDRHPPWWRHLFIADVLADIWVHIVSRLQDTQNAPYKTSTALYAIPAPFYESQHTSSPVCDTTKPYVIDARPNSTFAPNDVHTYETDLAKVPKLGWREYIDYHNTPGFIINSLSDPNQAVLSFPLDNRSTYHKLLLKIVYLKSYTGMGMVYIRLCGDYLHQQAILDGLYHDHATYKVSLPTEFIYKITTGDNDRCQKMPAQRRTLDVLYHRSKDEFESVRAHAHQKFKLMAVEICVAAPLVL